MGVLGQLGLVLWKNLILRKRQPVILLLEIIWPIVIFLIVTLVRRSVPPTQVTSCHYAPRAMPTAGISFLQDFVCNLDNKCYPSEEAAHKSRTESGTASFLQAVSPLYQQRNDTQKFLENLPQTKKVLDSVTETLAKPNVKKLLDFNPVVKNFFRDPQRVRHYLVNEAQILTGPTADAILDASINVSKIFKLAGNIDFKGVVCNPAELGRYLSFQGVPVETVSRDLCAVNDSMIGNISTFLQSQIDVASIIRIAKRLEESMGQYDVAAGLNDLAIMMDLILNLNSTNQLLGDMMWIKGSLDWGLKIQDFIVKLTSNGQLQLDDLKLIGKVLQDLDHWFANESMFAPVHEALAPIKSAISQIEEVLKWMNGQMSTGSDLNKLYLGDLFNNKTGLGDMLIHMGNISTDAMMALANLQMDPNQMTNFINAAAKGNITGPICVHPGLDKLYPTNSTQLQTQLKQIKAYICSPNNTASLMDLMNISDIYRKMTDMQKPHSPTNWTSLLQDITQIAVGMQSTFDQMGPLLNMVNSSFSIESLYRSLGQMAGGFNNMNGSMSAIDQLMPMLNQLSSQTAQFMPNNTANDMYFHIIYTAVEIMDHLSQKMNLFGNQLHQLLQDNADFRTTVQGIIALDPKMAPDILAKIMDPIRIQALMQWADVEKIMCDSNGLTKFLELDPTKVNITALNGLMCNRNLSSVLQTIANNFDVQGIQMKIDHMIAVIEGRSPAEPVDYNRLNAKIQSLVNTLSVQSVDKVFMDAFSGIPGLLDPTALRAGNWTTESFLKQLSQSFIVSISSSLTTTIGRQVEQSSAWPIVAGPIKATYSLLQAAKVGMHFFMMLNNETTELGKVARVFIHYFPEVLYEFSQLNADQAKFQMFLAEATADPMGLFCNYSRMSAYLDPISQLPLQSVQEVMCKVNYPQINMTVMMAWNDVSSHVMKAFNYMFSMESDTALMNMNWTDMFHLGEKTAYFVMDYMNNPSKLSHWERFNYTRLLDAMMVSMTSMQSFNNMSIMNGLSDQTAMVESLLASMTNTDNTMNYYVYAINNYIRVTIKYMEMWDKNGLLLTDFVGNSTWLHSRVNDVKRVLPDILKSLENVTLNQEQFTQKISGMNLTGMEICKDISITDIFNVKNSTKMKELEMLLCGVNITVLMQELMQTPMMKEYNDAMSMLTMYDPTKLPANYTANMTELMNNIMAMVAQYTKPMSPDSTSKLFPEFMAGLNTTAVEGTGQKIMDNLMKMMMAYNNATNMNTQSLTDQTAMIEGLLASIATDNTVNYYVYAINEYIKVTIKYMQGWDRNGLLLSDFIGTSSWLQSRVQDLKHVLPDLLHSLENVTVNQEQFIQKMTSMNMTGVQLCQNMSITEILTVKNATKIKELEMLLCGVNLTVLMQELMQTPMMMDYSSVVMLLTQYDPSKLPTNYTANMTELINNVMVLIDQYTKAMASNSTDKFFPDLISHFNTSVIQTTGQKVLNNLMKTLAAYSNTTNMFNAQSIQDQSAMLESLFPNMSMPGFDQAYNYYMYAINEFIKAEMKYLKSWGQNGLLLTDFIGNATWLHARLNDTKSALPALLERLSNVTLSPDKLLIMMTSMNLNGTQLCVDIKLTDFLNVKDQSQLKDLETLLCGLNVTAITDELMQTPMMKEFSMHIMRFTHYDPVNMMPANYVANVTEVINNLIALITHMATPTGNQDLASLLLPDLMANFDLSAVNMTGQNLIDQLMKMDMNSILQLAGMSSSMLAAGSMPQTPETKMIIAYIDAIVEVNIRSMILFEPEKFMGAFPNLARYKFVFDGLPDILAGLIITNADSKTQQAFNAALSNPMVLCMMPNVSHIIKMPPNSQVDINAVLKELCTINMTLVMMDFDRLAAYLSEPMMKAASVPDVDMTKLMEKIQKIQMDWTMMFSGNMTTATMFDKLLGSFKLIDGNRWQTVVGGAMNKTMSMYNTTNPADFMGYTQSLSDLNNMLNNSDLNKQLNMIDAIITEAISKLNLLNVNSSLADMFPKSTELAKMARMVEHFPYIFEVIAYSYNNPKFQALFSSSNLTEVFLTLCHPLSNLSDILTVPANWTEQGVNLADLQQEFCAIDVMKLEAEVYVEFNIKYIMDQAQNPAPVNWTILFYKISMASEQLGKVIATPPREFTAGSWTNGTLWLSILMALNQQQMQQANSQESLQSYYNSVELLASMLGNDTAALLSLTASMSSFVKYINQQIDLILKPNLSIYDLFADSPETLKLFGVVNSSSDLTLALLKIPLLNTTALLNLQNETSESLCNKSLLYYKSMFQINEDNTAQQLRDIMCKIDPKAWEKISQELVNKIGIAELLAALGYQPSMNSTQMASSNQTINWTDLSKDIETLTQKLMTLFGNMNMTANFTAPAYNMTAIEETIAKLYTNMDANNINSLLPAIMASMAPLYGTPMWDMVVKYQQSAEVIVNYFNDMLMMLQPDVNGKVEIEALFGNSTQWKQLLRGALDIGTGPDMMSLSMITIKSDKITQLVMLNQSHLQNLLCNESMMREYIEFPASVNLTKIVGYTCSLDAATLMKEFEQQFDIAGLIQRVMNPPNATSFNMDAMLMKYTKLVEDLMKLGNITDPSFFGKTIGHFMHIDPAKFMNMNMTDVLNTALASIPGGASVPMNLTSVEDMVNYAFTSLQTSLGQMGVMYQDEGYSIFLRLLDRVMRTLLDRLDKRAAVNKANVFTLGGLVGNIPELEQVLQTALNLDPATVMALMNANIPLEKLLMSVGSGNMSVIKEHLCQPNITLEWFKIPPGGNLTVLQQQLCAIDYNVLWEKIQVYIDYKTIMPLFEKLLNASHPTVGMFNWTDYSQNIQAWKEAINVLLSNPPQISPDLAKLFDPAKMMQFVNVLMQQQMTDSWVSSMYSFLFDLPGEAPQMLNYYLELLIMQYQNFQKEGYTFSELLTDNELLQKYNKIFFEAISRSSLDMMTTTSAKDIFKLVPAVATFKVCDVQMLNDTLMNRTSTMQMPAYWNIQQISDILCKNDSSQWYQALELAGYHPSDIHQIAMAIAVSYNISVATPSGTPWTTVQKNLETLTTLLTQLFAGFDQALGNMTMADSMKIWDALLAGTGNSSITQIIDMLKLTDLIFTQSNMDTTMMREIVHLTASILNYTNSQLQEMHNGTHLLLGKLFPDEASLREELGKYLSNQSINDLMKISMSPAMMSNMTNATAWQEFVCNMTMFNKTVSAANVTNIKQLQSELCSTAMDGNNIMSILLQQMNMKSFMDMLTNLASNQTSSTPMNQNPYNFLQQQLNTLMGNLGLLQGPVNMQGAMEWFNLFNGILNTPMTQMQMPGASNYVDMCTATVAQLDQSFGNSSMLNTALQTNHVYMKMYIQYMDSLQMLSNLTCEMSVLDLTGMYKKFNESGMMDYITSVIEMSTNPNGGLSMGKFDCTEYVDTMTKYMEIINSSMHHMTDTAMANQAMQCFIDSSQKSLPALQQIDGIFGLIVQIQTLLKDMSMPGTELGQILPYVDVIVQTLFQQKPLLTRFADLVYNASTVEETLLNVYNLSQDVVNAVMSSTIDLTLATIWNSTAEELEQILCNSTALARLMNLPEELFNVSLVSQHLCQSNITASIKDSLDIGKIFYQLSQTVPTYDFTSDWLKNIAADIEKLTASITPLLEMSDLMNNFDISKLAQQLPKLQQFSDSGGIDTVIDNIKSIVMSISEIIPDEGMNQMILNDLLILIDGLRGLKLINMTNIDVVLKDVIKDPKAVEDYMIFTLGLSPDVAMAVLNSKFSFTELLNLTQRLDLQKLICDPAELSTLLSLNSNVTTNMTVTEGNVTYTTQVNVSSTGVTLNDISTELCAMGEQQIINLVNFVQGQLEIGDILQQMIALSPEAILRNVGVDVKDFQKTLQTFAPLQESFKQFSEQMQNLPEDLLTSAEALQQGQNTDSTKTLSKLMCGRDNAFSIADEFQLGGSDSNNPQNSQVEPTTNVTSGRRKKRQTSCGNTWSDWQRYEMSRLRTSFCIDMYKGLQCSENGRIIWSFMKPLLIGRIPFTPDNDITRTIMTEATQIFRDVEQIKSFSKLFMNSSSYLQNFANSSAQLNTLEEALKNPFVNQVIYDVVGMDPKVLTDQLKSLSGVTTKQLNALKTVSELMYNASFCVHQYRIESYQDETTLLKQAHYYAERNELLAAISFIEMENIQKSNNSHQTMPACEFSLKYKSPTPKHLKFKIMIGDENVPDTYGLNRHFWVPGPEDSFAENLRYFRGFIQLQDLIERAIIKLQTGCEGEMPIVESEQFPYPCYEEDLFQKYVSLYMFPVMMTLAWLVVVGSSIRNIVYDKEHRLEEAMQAMGLKSRINWLGWFLNTYILMLIMDLVIVMFLKFGNLYRFSDFGLLFVFLATFSLCTLMMCYLVSVFFYRTTLAALVGLIVYLVSYVPYIVLANMSEITLEFWQIFLACLSGTTAFSYGAQMVSHMEQRGVGMQWSDVSDGTLYKNFSFAWIFYSMLIDSAIYFIIAWYLRNVIPGKYGVSQPFYFPLSPYYWGCGGKSSHSALYKPHNGAQKNVYDGDGSVQGLYIKRLGTSPSTDEHGSLPYCQPSTAKSDNGEGDPENLPIGISLHNLTKKFNNKRAINDVTVNFYQDQITAFLGQNGAGKSTTVNVLTGILEPTSGDALINSHSIRKDMTNIRKDLGVCPQHDVLFEYLTVYEHMDFYASLKGKQSKREIKEDISRMLDLTGLRSSSSVKVSQLSGGQKRRLSVALAFIGGSNIVILDEPTSGIDSCARRSIWDLIIQNRPGRTIIISTHHMDEADVLGDRIVLMHKGKVLCTGSPLYLKSQFGSGYQLTMSKQAAVPHYANADEAPVTDNSKTSAALAFLLKFIPDAQLVEEVGTEITFMLPTHQGQLATFPELFHQLEANKHSLDISSYGVSDTTLEEVFLKVTRTADAGKPLDPVIMRQNHYNKDDKEDGKKLTGTSLTNGVERPQHSAPENKPNVCSQIGALLYKRFWHHIKDYRSYFSQIILPVLFICLAMGMAIIVPDAKDQPSVQLTPEMYKDTSSFYRMNDNNDLFKLYEYTMLNSPDTLNCLHNPADYGTCKLGKDNQWDTNSINSADYNKYANPGACQCDLGKQECPVGASGLPSPHITMDTGLEMYNLTGNQFPVNEYLSRTLNDFVKNRYGGLSFNKDGQDKKSVIWFNNKGYHSLPAYQNALSNLFLHARLANQSKTNYKDYKISVYNHPLPQSKEQLSQATLLQTIAENGLAIVILCAFCFVPAGYTIFLVGERVNKEKLLQMVYGVNVLTYWITTLVWDMLTFLFSVGLAVLIIYLFNIDTYNARENLLAVAVTLILFGWACIPLMYLMCRLFKDVSTAYITVFLVNLFIGVCTVVCTFLLSLFLYMDNIKDAYNILNHVFKIFPQYCLGDSLVRLSRNQFISRVYEQFNIDKYKSPFSMEDNADTTIAWHLIAMAIQGLVFFIINLMFEAKCNSTRGGMNYDQNEHSPMKRRMNNHNKDLDYKEDSDVSLERQRVRTGGAKNDALVLHGLRKMYRRGFKKVTAVDNISVGVPKGECFGLLGVNGAGKTTTFNMITGEINPDRGAAAFNGRIISGDNSQMEGEVGYCPQIDALDGFLTGRQLLHFYADIKGVPSDTSDYAINGLIQGLGLVQHADTMIKKYSGGTKRKLSTAIALLGNPKLVLLDEPTTGMDAGSRRQLWDRILDIIKSGASVVLTSHSMTECDALCTRMAIMVNGRFMCLGNSQHLKSKYGTGYTVITKVSGIPPDLQTVVHFMKDNFPGSFLKDSHLNQLEFEIPISSATLGEIFGKLEADKSMLHLQEYSLSQPTLDQVFINFARCQSDGLEDNELDLEEGGHIKAYTNQAYGTIGGPQTPILPRGRHEDVRESLKSIPGYGKDEVDSNDVKIDVSQPSTSASPSGSASPASTIHKDRPHSAEISIVDSETGDITSQIINEDDGKTVVAL